MQGVEKKTSGRLFYLDLLRVIACLSVVMIHVSADFVVRGTKGPDFWVGNLFDSLSRAGVPLFVMISGALMLDENYDFTVKKWLGHMCRMTVFYVVWLKVCGWIGSPDYHLWFVPMIVGLYALVPIMRLWVNEQNVVWVECFLLVSLVFAFIAPQVTGIVPGTDRIKTFMDNLNLGFAPGYAAYFVLGWYLNRGVRRWKLVGLLGIAGLFMTFAGTGFAAVMLRMKEYPFYENFTVNVLAYSAAIFTLCRMKFEQPRKPDGAGRKIVGWISKYSLGIYGVHLYFISQFLPLVDGMHTAAAILLLFVLTMTASAAVSMILHQIPLIRKIV